MRAQLVNESYMAWVLRVDRSAGPIAVKVARPPRRTAVRVAPAFDVAQRNAFIRHERAIRARLAGAKVAPILSAGTHGGLEYFTTPWVATIEPSAAGSVAAWHEAAAVVEAVGELHSLGVAHGDLEPEHVLLTTDGVVLVDFGSARLLVGDDADESLVARDVFSLGCLLSERLLGYERFPYRARVEKLVATELLKSLPHDHAGVIVGRALRALTNPSAAYASVSELASDLRRATAVHLAR